MGRESRNTAVVIFVFVLAWFLSHEMGPASHRPSETALAAASASGLMPVASYLFLAEASCYSSSFTISTSPFAMA